MKKVLEGRSIQNGSRGPVQKSVWIWVWDGTRTIKDKRSSRIHPPTFRLLAATSLFNRNALATQARPTDEMLT